MQTDGDDMDALAADYATGRLSAPLRLLVEARGALDSGMASTLAAADMIGGACLESVAPVAMAPDALSQALKTIEAIELAAAERVAAARAGEALDEVLKLPAPVRDAALAEMEHARGWRFAAPGIRIMELARDGATKAELIRIEPGVGTPKHGHGGDEYTLVLAGAFRVSDEVYRRGDLCVAGPDVKHQPVAELGEPCLCLAVTDAPLAFTGALGVMQRVFRLH